MATPAQQQECRKTILSLHNTSATGQAARRAVARVTPRVVVCVQRRLQQRQRQQRQRRLLRPHPQRHVRRRQRQQRQLRQQRREHRRQRQQLHLLRLVQQHPPRPPARYALQATLGTDNMLYIPGGQAADPTPIVYDQVSRYNYTTNTWSNVAPLPVALGQGTIGAWNGKIYVAGGLIGGTSVTNALRIYDIASNTWSSGPNMPTSPGVEAAAGAVVNGKFYVMGGDDFNNGLNTTFIYDIATNTWTTGATLPDFRTNTYGTAYNGLIYVYGGVILPAFTTTDTLLRYDPVANSWTNLGSAGTGGRGNYGGISPLGTGQLLITDGALNTGVSTTATHIFTISSGTFSAGPAMIGNRAGHAQGILPDGRVLVADGFNTASTVVSTVALL